jgi:transcriptional regulator with XRE-family HTH domain
LRDFLSANIKARREVLGISQEKLAELANVSIQMIKGIEGRRTWVSDNMMAKLALVLGVRSFQLLIPENGPDLSNDTFIISSLLNNLRENIKYDIDSRIDRLLPEE